MSHVEALIEPKIAEHDGRLIRTLGHEGCSQIDSTVDAVRCGLEIQRSFAVRNAEVDSDRQIRLRVGVSVGDVIVTDQDIYGNGVNIAARLEGVAEGGEVDVTRSAHDQLHGQPALRFEDRGERRVENMGRPIRVYRVRSAPEQPTAFPRPVIMRLHQPVRMAFGPHKRSAAVLAAALADRRRRDSGITGPL